MHQEIHIREKESFGFKYQELGCERAFKLPSQLKAHILWHTGHEGHVCSRPGCKLRFETLRHLKDHMKTHNREKPFKCEICGKDHMMSSSLRSHMKRHGQEEYVSVSLDAEWYSQKKDT
ncbi:E3 SUMO-protein ligase EGR2-like [Cryptotermes secundus]|uniref:E3 SUMO-protein ligase EGR2-like n=1 Tax=Cryptotermes secundus TaxID=105785 RepID=UPI000CD7BF00|nr:E3 SUMO-protein ligase EGR2-like [Cryptotermes secundus]XP_033610212.1 E3 SUMO-protein ligase EGR2-like [Cryptotermes secundus]